MLVQKKNENILEEKKYFCYNCGINIEKDCNFCHNCGRQIKNFGSDKEKNENNNIEELDTKKFDNTCNCVFNNSMNTINVINQIMTNYGAKVLIKENIDEFVMKTYLVCLYFYNINLKKNNIFNSNIIGKMYEALIKEMCQRTNINFEIANKDYFAIRDLLDKISGNEYGDSNPLMRAAVAYLEIAFDGRYDMEKLDDEKFGELLFNIATEFKNIISDVIN